MSEPSDRWMMILMPDGTLAADNGPVTIGVVSHQGPNQDDDIAVSERWMPKVLAALKAAPQAEKAREIIERAEKAIMRVASQTDVSVGADTELGCWWCEAPAGEDHASDCLGSKLLADIAAYKEG